MSSKDMAKIIVKERALTSKQQLFCQEYIVDLNATQAAKRAGYKPGINGINFDKVGPANLVKVGIKSEIDRLKAVRAEKTEITAALVLSTIKAIITNPESKDTDKLRGAELLGRHLGMFNDKLEVTSKIKPFSDMTPDERESKANEMIDIIIHKRTVKLGNMRKMDNLVIDNRGEEIREKAAKTRGLPRTLTSEVDSDDVREVRG